MSTSGWAEFIMQIIMYQVIVHANITKSYKERFFSIVGYLTMVSDLDLAPNTDQFVASPPVR